jgi:hypothetical protein
LPMSYRYSLVQPHDRRSSLAIVEIPSVFPSLGNLAALSYSRTSEENDPGQSLTFLCRQLKQVEKTKSLQRQSKHTLLVDYLETFADEESCDRIGISSTDCNTSIRNRYTKLPLNFTSLHGRNVLRVPFGPSSGSDCNKDKGEFCLTNDIFQGAVLILAIDSARDRFPFEAIDRSYLTGAEIHALQAHMVSDPSTKLLNQSWVSILSDFIVGLAFILVSNVLAALSTLSKLKTIKFVAVTLFPVFFGIAVAGVLVTWWVPWLYEKGLWINPGYVLAGMVLHTYFDLGEKTKEQVHIQIAPSEVDRGPALLDSRPSLRDPQSHHSQPFDFTFGFRWWFLDRVDFQEVSTIRIADQALTATVPAIIITLAMFVMVDPDDTPVQWKEVWIVVAMFVAAICSYLKKSKFNLKKNDQYEKNT